MIRYLYFTVGKLIGTSSCDVPTLGIDWKHALNPTLLSEVLEKPINQNAPYTTVMKWQSNKPIKYGGKVLGQKDVEFEKILGFPSLIDEELEVAVSGANVPRERLSRGGWKIKDADDVGISIDSYRNYVADSKGEFSIAKNAFVQTRCGWIGDREGFYLGSGRPVILQDTGFSDFLPCGQGLLSFQTIEEAKEAIKAVSSDYKRHSKSAREIAYEYFDSEKVLFDILSQIGL